jgi:hypothetical protein
MFSVFAEIKSLTTMGNMISVLEEFVKQNDIKTRHCQWIDRYADLSWDWDLPSLIFTLGHTFLP